MAAEHATQSVRVEQLAELEGDALLDQIIDTGIRPTSGQASRDRAHALVKSFVAEFLDPSKVVSKNVLHNINARIAAIDSMLSTQLDEILHHSDFQKLEASWRGLHKLVMGTETGQTLKLKVLNVSKRDILRDFQSAAEFTESALWKKVYEEEFGMFGGDPFGALMGDFEFGKGAQDVELLSRISEVAAAAHAPFISATSAEMFGLASFTSLSDPRDLAKTFDRNNPENAKWLSFRESPNANFTCLVLPHVLRRLPYGVDNPIEDFDYTEQVDAHNEYVWGNAAYDFAQRMTAAFARAGWCVAIRGPEGGGLVEDLPIHVFKTREGDTASKCPTEMLIPDTREKELSDLGFIGLLNRKNTDLAAFFGASSCQRPKKYDKPEATASAKLSSQIPYLMASCRIAHYLKAICRDKIGQFMSRTECEDLLNKWIQNYVISDDNASALVKAQYPLREAQIEVFDDKARPGCYKARAFIRPHFQLDEISVSLGLVTELPAAKG
jgi:type VI secretion system protein ImpC